MHSSTDLPLDPPFQSKPTGQPAVVQDRPTLGSMPRASRGVWWWLPPAIDLVSSSVALTLIAVVTNSALFPALPIAPILLVFVYAALGVYGSHPSRGPLSREDGLAWPVIRLLVAALFAWVASLLTPLDGPAQLALWAFFVLLDTAARKIGSPLMQRFDVVERWVLVGDEATAERLRAYQPLRAFATVVGTVPPGEDGTHSAGRVAALEVVDRYRADRVVIASHRADDESLLDLVRAFKSIGVPVSLLPRPLDLLEAPAATPNQVGGVPLIEVEALATRRSTPYRAPIGGRTARPGSASSSPP